MGGLVTSLLLHCPFIFIFSVNYNWPSLNTSISLISQPILVKFWIIHLMTNPNIVYDTTPNLNHIKSQLISSTSNAYISINSTPILVKLRIIPFHNQSYQIELYKLIILLTSNLH